MWPEAPSAATRVALDAREHRRRGAAEAHFVEISCLSSVAVADADADAEGRRSTPLPDVVPLLNRRDVWRGLANVFVACVARTEPHVRGFASDSALRMTHSAASEPTVSDPAAAAALRRGAAAALLAAARLAPAVVGVAMAPKPETRPWMTNSGCRRPGTSGVRRSTRARSRCSTPRDGTFGLAASPPEVLSWAAPPTTAAEDAASAAATVAALAGALAAGELERCADDEGASASEREELRAAASCFASARLAADTGAVPASRGCVGGAAAALIRRHRRARAARLARGTRLAARPSRAPFRDRRLGSRRATPLRAAWKGCRGAARAPAAWGSASARRRRARRRARLAADGAATPAAAGTGGAGAGLAEAARSACQLVATLFRSPASARVVMSRAAAAESDSNAAGAPASAVGPVGARLATSLAKLWRAQAVGVPGGRGAPWRREEAACRAAPPAAALRNVLAYSASAKRAAAEADLVAPLLKIMTKSRKILAYDAAAAAAEEAARVAATAGSRGRGRDGVSDSFARAARPLGPAPKPLAMDADLVLSECVSLLKHALYRPPGAVARRRGRRGRARAGTREAVSTAPAGRAPVGSVPRRGARAADLAARRVFARPRVVAPRRGGWRTRARTPRRRREPHRGVCGCETRGGGGGGRGRRRPVSLAERMLPRVSKHRAGDDVAFSAGAAGGAGDGTRREAMVASQRVHRQDDGAVQSSCASW